MRAYEILNERDQSILRGLRWYYKMKQGRSSIGFNSHYRLLKENTLSLLSEKFLDPEIEKVITDMLPNYSTNNPLIAVDIISNFGEQRQELLIRIYKIIDETISHDRKHPESDKLVFDSREDAISFVAGLKMQFGGNNMDEYHFIIDNELEGIE